jgi:AraC-like DNA-binding protein
LRNSAVDAGRRLAFSSASVREGTKRVKKLIQVEPAGAEVILPVRFAYTVESAAAVLDVSRSTIYTLFTEGRLTPRKILNRTVILDADLRKFLAELPAADVRIAGDAA